MALIRKRDLYIRLEKWSDASKSNIGWSKPTCLKAKRRAEANLLLGCMYEVGRQLWSVGIRIKLGAISAARSRKTGPFCRPISASGKSWSGRAKPKTRSKFSKKSMSKHAVSSFCTGLEELYLELGEPDEIIRAYQEALQQDPHKP